MSCNGDHASLAELFDCLDCASETDRLAPTPEEMGYIPATGQTFEDYFGRDDDERAHAEFLEAQARAAGRPLWSAYSNGAGKHHWFVSNDRETLTTARGAVQWFKSYETATRAADRLNSTETEGD